MPFPIRVWLRWTHPFKSAAFWIPAFAGMTGVESENDEGIRARIADISHSSLLSLISSL